LVSDLSDIARAPASEAHNIRSMSYDAPEFLTRDQFISLLMVGDVTPAGLAPIIPIDHETLLVRLGYVVNLQGRLRITTYGRQRLASIEATPGAGKTGGGTAQTRPRPRSDQATKVQSGQHPAVRS
jgi:hypothetical protein